VQNKTYGVTQGVGPEFKPHYCKKKQKQKTKTEMIEATSQQMLVTLKQ
jgi:glutamine amidotransferase-like uncharacterized protein